MSNIHKTLLALVCPLFLLSTARAEPMRLAGAPTVSLPLLDAAKILKNENKIDVQISFFDENLRPTREGGTSTTGITALGAGFADVAMSSRRVTGVERAQFPKIVFTEFYFGGQATVLAVSRDVWESGVRALTKPQARGIYEGQIRNWKEVGGANREIVGYTANWGYGVRESFMEWIYDDPGKTRPNRFAVVNSNEEAKACIETTPGSIAQISMPWADGKSLFVLAIKGDDGKVIEPTMPAVASHEYPMSKPLLLMINGPPMGNIKTLLKFMLGPAGQELLHQHSYFTLKELGLKPQPLD